MRNIFFYFISWIIINIIAVILFATQTRPFYSLGPTDLIHLVLISQLFFISIVFPLLVRQQFEHIRYTQCKLSELWSTLVGEPRGLLGILGCNSLRSNSRWIKPDDKILPLASQIIIFLILFLPLTLFASYFGLAEASVTIRMELLVIVSGGIAIGAARAGRLRAYYFIWTLIMAGLPVLQYLILEMTNVDVILLLRINPFWLVGQLTQPDIFYGNWLLQVFIGILILVGMVVPNGYRAKRKVI